jgi:hypothetical protein
MSGFSINFGGLGFSWQSDRKDSVTTLATPRRPGPRDMTGGFQANEAMLKGLYKGTHPGLQFASPLCYTPVNLLVQFMGYPTPRAEGDHPETQAALDFLVKFFRPSRIHRGALIVGTAWRWPRFDSSQLSLACEAIPDSVITDILIDIASERPYAILTDERIRLSTGENQIANVQRTRRFEPGRVSVRWLGERPQSVQDEDAVNVSGSLPSPFAHDADEGEIRGTSVFSRAIRILKDYHDTKFRISETLTKFRVKQVQTVRDPAQWRKENGLDDESAFASYDIADNDLIINRENETTKYEFLPKDATEALEKALGTDFWLVVESQGMPELFFGPLATGNHASTDVNLDQAVKYAESERGDMTPPWQALLAAGLRILSVARGENYKGFTMGWNRLDGVSPQVKSEIFLRFTQAAAQLVNSATCTPKQLHRLWEINFPESDPGDFKEFLGGIEEMMRHKQALGLDPFSGLEDFQAKGEPKKTEATPGDADAAEGGDE